LIAPDGPVCFIPFCALPGSHPDTYLIEDFEISYIPAGRQLYDLHSRPPLEGAGLLAIGNVQYSMGDKPRDLAATTSHSLLPGNARPHFLGQVERGLGLGGDRGARIALYRLGSFIPAPGDAAQLRQLQAVLAAARPSDVLLVPQLARVLPIILQEAVPNLVRNPRTPPAISTNFVGRLNGKDIKLIAQTGHYHFRGRRFSTFEWFNGVRGAEIYHHEGYADPIFLEYKPPLLVPAGHGLEWECYWENPNDVEYKFGPFTDTNEHCNLFAFYYPTESLHEFITCVKKDGVNTTTVREGD
jgi:hypothetical protein